MKKQIIAFISNVVIIFGCVGIVTNVSPYFKNEISSFSSSVVGLANPGDSIDNAKSKISDYINDDQSNNTTTRVEKTVPAMNAIGSKDSDDDCDITETPADIAKLMKKAKKSYSKAKKLGKTSEGAYQGGGTIISYNGVEIQNKIPSSFYKPNIKKLLSQGADLKIKDKSKPTILIYHSHTTESYSLLDTGYYTEADSRSNDINRNMVRVGDELVKYLEKAGFVVIHDKAIHDTDYNLRFVTRGNRKIS